MLLIGFAKKQRKQIENIDSLLRALQCPKKKKTKQNKNPETVKLEK